MTDSPQGGAVGLGLLLALVLPWLWGWTPGPSPNVVPLLVSWGCAAVAVSILVCLPGAHKSVRPLIPAAWLIAAGASSLIALAQWFGIAAELPFISDGQAGQGYGNLRQRNQLATLTSLGLVSALWFRAIGAGRWCYACVILLAMGNAASVSRTGLLQWLLVPLLVLAWAPGARRALWQLWLVGIAAYAASAWLLPLALFHLLGITAPDIFARVGADLGCSSRAVLWSNVMHLIAQRPWFGWGPGDLAHAHYATLYPGPRFCDILDNAHNLPLHLAVEVGLPAAAAVCLGVLWLVVRGRPWADRDPDRQLAWSVLVMIGLHSLLEYPLWHGPFQLAVVLCLVLLCRRGLPHVAPPYAIGAALVTLACLLYVWRVYDTVSQAFIPPEQRRAALRLDPIGTAGRPPFFRAQLQFAELSITPLSQANAAQLNALAAELLHYSPEPKVIEKLIESSVLLGRDDLALWHASRYRAAFPDAYQAWTARN